MAEHEQLKASARADPNMGDLMQQEHLQNYDGIAVRSLRTQEQKNCKNCNISDTVQDRTKVTMTD